MAASGMLPGSGQETPAERQRNRPPQPRGPGGRFAVVHGAYVGQRALHRPDRRRSLVRRAEALHLAYAIACGHPSLTVAPAPLRAAIKSAVRLELFAEALFRPFWSGGEVPRRFEGATELLRRVLALVGLEPRAAAGPDVAALLAAMRVEEERRR